MMRKNTSSEPKPPRYGTRARRGRREPFAEAEGGEELEGREAFVCIYRTDTSGVHGTPAPAPASAAPAPAPTPVPVPAPAPAPTADTTVEHREAIEVDLDTTETDSSEHSVRRRPHTAAVGFGSLGSLDMDSLPSDTDPTESSDTDATPSEQSVLHLPYDKTEDPLQVMSLHDAPPITGECTYDVLSVMLSFVPADMRTLCTLMLVSRAWSFYAAEMKQWRLLRVYMPSGVLRSRLKVLTDGAKREHIVDRHRAVVRARREAQREECKANVLFTAGGFAVASALLAAMLAMNWGIGHGTSTMTGDGNVGPAAFFFTYIIAGTMWMLTVSLFSKRVHTHLYALKLFTLMFGSFFVAVTFGVPFALLAGRIKVAEQIAEGVRYDTECTWGPDSIFPHPPTYVFLSEPAQWTFNSVVSVEGRAAVTVLRYVGTRCTQYAMAAYVGIVGNFTVPQVNALLAPNNAAGTVSFRACVNRWYYSTDAARLDRIWWDSKEWHGFRMPLVVTPPEPLAEGQARVDRLYGDGRRLMLAAIIVFAFFALSALLRSRQYVQYHMSVCGIVAGVCWNALTLVIIGGVCLKDSRPEWCQCSEAGATSMIVIGSLLFVLTLFVLKHNHSS